jgi:hypothetical protein
MHALGLAWAGLGMEAHIAIMIVRDRRPFLSIIMVRDGGLYIAKIIIRDGAAHLTIKWSGIEAHI